MRSIEREWLNLYVGSLLRTASLAGGDSALGRTSLQRAEYVLDMVDAWNLAVETGWLAGRNRPPVRFEGEVATLVAPSLE